MDELIRTITSDFVAGMSKSGNFARQQVVALIRELDADELGAITASQRNEQLIDGVSIGLQQVALSGTFQARINKVINAVPKLRKETERKFIVKHGVIRPATTVLLNQLQADVENNLEDALGEVSIIEGVVGPVVQIMNGLLNSGLSADSAIRLADKIPSLFTEFAHTRVDTSLQIYVREMTRAMAAAEGLKWFKYAGPSGPSALGNPIRDFCKVKVGNVYLDSEIEKWPVEQSPWEGEIPGTNSFSIFALLGGYNCRHNLEAVANNAVPDKDVKRAQSKNLI